uniref:Uncharacterized protein n=1 Tax=Anguilla anguilla TaxID=7936 RepID=A0A0E9QNK2_ANGAN
MAIGWTSTAGPAQLTRMSVTE